MQTQFQYLDIGMNLDATLEDSPDGLRLKSKIEESVLGQPSTHRRRPGACHPPDLLEGTSEHHARQTHHPRLLDIAGTTRHIDIEVVAEPIS